MQAVSRDEPCVCGIRTFRASPFKATFSQHSKRSAGSSSTASTSSGTLGWTSLLADSEDCLFRTSPPSPSSVPNRLVSRTGRTLGRITLAARVKVWPPSLLKRTYPRCAPSNVTREVSDRKMCCWWVAMATRNVSASSDVRSAHSREYIRLCRSFIIP